MKKYELVKSNKPNLYRVRALRDFSNITAGDMGGYVKNKNTLSQTNNCWIYGDTNIYESTNIYDDVWVHDEDDVEITGDTIVCRDADGDNQMFDSIESLEQQVKTTCNNLSFVLGCLRSVNNKI